MRPGSCEWIAATPIRSQSEVRRHPLNDTDTPGVRPSDVLSCATDALAAQLLPQGALNLIERLDPSLLSGGQRGATLGRLFSIETAVDDPSRRARLFEMLSREKRSELAQRIGRPIEEISADDYTLSTPERRAVLGFFGASLGAERAAPSEPLPDRVGTVHGLFPHQKRAASEVERNLYQESGRVMLHLPTGVGKTRTAMSIVATHLRGRSEGLVIWLAAARELLEQATEEFSKTWTAVGDRDVDCLRFWADHDPADRDDPRWHRVRRPCQAALVRKGSPTPSGLSVTGPPSWCSTRLTKPSQRRTNGSSRRWSPGIRGPDY